jgi:hypothetical protein
VESAACPGRVKPCMPLRCRAQRQGRRVAPCGPTAARGADGDVRCDCVRAPGISCRAAGTHPRRASRRRRARIFRVQVGKRAAFRASLSRGPARRRPPRRRCCQPGKRAGHARPAGAGPRPLCVATSGRQPRLGGPPVRKGRASLGLEDRAAGVCSGRTQVHGVRRLIGLPEHGCDFIRGRALVSALLSDSREGSAWLCGRVLRRRAARVTALPKFQFTAPVPPARHPRDVRAECGVDDLTSPAVPPGAWTSGCIPPADVRQRARRECYVGSHRA